MRFCVCVTLLAAFPAFAISGQPKTPRIVRAIAFSPTKHVIAAGFGDQVHLFDAKTGVALHTLEPAHAAGIRHDGPLRAGRQFAGLRSLRWHNPRLAARPVRRFLTYCGIPKSIETSHVRRRLCRNNNADKGSYWRSRLASFRFDERSQLASAVNTLRPKEASDLISL
jgi:hypothetical protein